MRNQAPSTSAMCRTMPSSDRFDGGTGASASCSPVSPAHFHSSVARCQSRKPSTGASFGAGERLVNPGGGGLHVMLVDRRSAGKPRFFSPAVEVKILLNEYSDCGRSALCCLPTCEILGACPS
jgi:hypothetical protein